MAIHFHEGLPGAGKSYEACVYHILAALKAGRQVVTNIRGINFAKFAELLDESEEYVRILLIVIEPAEQDDDESQLQRVKNEFADRTPDNALIVWDEIQDYYPSGSQKLPHNQQKFWTEHRHRGLDIVIMGQDRDDVHKIIRSRIVGIVYFLKLEAVGRSNQYKWEQLQKQAKGRFVKIGSGVRSYDPKYFGLYMSHRREGIKSSVYTTSRSNVLKNSRMLSLGVPLAFVGAAFAVWHLWGFFHPVSASPSSAVTVSSPPAAQQSRSGLVNPDPPGVAKPASVAASGGSTASPSVPEPIDYFDRLAQQYQVRLSIVLDSKKPGRELMGYVEMLDGSYHVKEVLSVSDIRALGWTVARKDYGLLIEKQGVAHVARQWPLDLYGRVDNRTTQSLGGAEAQPGISQGGRPARLHVSGISPAKEPRTLE